MTLDLTEVASGLGFPEGPVAMADGSVLFVDIKDQLLRRLMPDGALVDVAKLPGGPNGTAIGPDGAAYVCNNGGVYSFEPYDPEAPPGSGKTPDPARWTDAHVALYREAATYPLTARIFANPLIKQQLCRTVTGDRSWLARVVPWYGHDGHMHVRLTCPPDSPWCVNQTPVDLSDDGCGGALAWWLSEAPYQQTGPSVPPPVPALPAPCAALAPN